MTQAPLILASASASRQAILRGAGLAFEAIPSGVDEDSLKAVARAGGMGPSALALELARAKARKVASDHPAALVLGADQILLCEDLMFDKPEGLAGAMAHLEALQGKTHFLIGALSLWRGDQELWTHASSPEMKMRPLSPEQIDAYLAAAGPDVCQSVGAYQLEGLGARLFEEIHGDYFAILGLALLPLLSELRRLGWLKD